MACQSDREAIIAASVELFHATMASLYNGITVSVSGSDGWWSGSMTSEWDETVSKYKWTGSRYEGSGSPAVYSYANGTITVAISYNLANMGTWDEFYGGTQ